MVSKLTRQVEQNHAQLDLEAVVPVDTRRRFKVYKTSVGRQRRRIDVF